MEANPDYGSTIPFMSFFSYQQMFAILTPALITGAFADRVNFKSYLVFLVLWSLLIYIPLAHWVWGGGFLQQMGVVDFAGGIVVHASAGLAALASVFFVGKRTVVSKAEMEPHNVTHVALGTALLWFGWFRVQRRRSFRCKFPGCDCIHQYRPGRIGCYGYLADHLLDP